MGLHHDDDEKLRDQAYGLSYGWRGRAPRLPIDLKTESLPKGINPETAAIIEQDPFFQKLDKPTQERTWVNISGAGKNAKKPKN
ncbi:MAG: hypothetical protein KDD56_03185 [Bdellovibrionales bacterium]|nr:hypothetical protein [Bdellovibrionales bacterium]